MSHTVYIGTYTQTNPDQSARTEGIYIYQLDSLRGRLQPSGALDGGGNPSFLAMHSNERFLYAANELKESMVSAFAIAPFGGGLKKINQQPTHGQDACYVTVSPSGRWLLAANYSSGSLSVFPILADGSLREMVDLVQHTGSGPNPRRQGAAHAHSVRFDPSGRFVVAADLGIDRILVYQLDKDTGKLTPYDPDGIATRPGAGPRHMVFRANGRTLYVANELDNTVAAYTWDAFAGKLTPGEVLPTLPADFHGESTVADIHLSPTGSFLYVSNRGHDSLACYQVDGPSGALTPAGIYPSGGKTPRNFAISPDGRFLLSANQDSNNLVVYAIAVDGSLTPTGTEVTIPSPVCVLFA